MNHEDTRLQALRLWKELLATALQGIPQPQHALDAWAAAGTLSDLDDFETPACLLENDVIRNACNAIAQIDADRLVDEAVTVEDTDMQGEFIHELWSEWMANTSALSSLQRSAARRSALVELGDALIPARSAMRNFDRCIRRRWSDLAPFAQGTAEIHFSITRKIGGHLTGTLLDDVLDWSADPKGHPVCPWGFGWVDAEELASTEGSKNEFKSHLKHCPLCEFRLARCLEEERDSQSLSVTIPFPLTLASGMAAAGGSRRPKHENRDVGSIGHVLIRLSPDRILLIRPDRADRVRMIELDGVPMNVPSKGNFESKISPDNPPKEIRFELEPDDEL